MMKTKYIPLLIVIGFCSICCQAQSLSELILDAREDIENLILSSDGLAAKFIRLAFHDAVGGGNDGCIDMEDPDNFGLGIPIDALEPIINQYVTPSSGLSRADMWVLAGLVGCEKSQTSLSFPMAYFGRVDCDDPSVVVDCSGRNGQDRACSSTTGPRADLPLPDLTTAELLRYFSETFGFSARETVAIMGAHTLGEASRQNSGFNGENGWVNRKNVLDNEYYGLLVGGNGPNDSIENLVNNAPGWQVRTVNNGDLPDLPDRVMWVRRPNNNNGPPLIMLNSDIAIVRDLDDDFVNENVPTCRFSSRGPNNQPISVCPYAQQTLEFAAEYRFDNSLWLDDFQDAFYAMVRFGYSADSNCNTRCLRLVTDGQASPSPSTRPVSAPTKTPTNPPTTAPSISNPTHSPTIAPSIALSTSNPTHSATTAPSISNPTHSPTIAPSIALSTSNPTHSATTASSTGEPIPSMDSFSSSPTLGPVDSVTDTPVISPVASTEGPDSSEEPMSAAPATEGPSLSPSDSSSSSNKVMWWVFGLSVLAALSC